jgi:hypothetical protein
MARKTTKKAAAEEEDCEEAGEGTRNGASSAFRAKHRQLPGIGSLIVANEICVAVRAPHFEVPVLGREPRVEHLGDIDATVSEYQRPRRLFTAVTCVALDTDIEERFFRHPIGRRATSCQD